MVKYDDILTTHLKGLDLATNAKLNWRENIGKVTDRVTLIVNIVKKKKIIHVGFCDHLPLIDFKIKKGIWFHKILSDSAEKCIGIDIDPGAIKYLSETYGFPGYCVDIMKDKLPEEISTEKWDNIIIGDVLEHLDQPIEFLRQVKLKFSGLCDSVLISVPNAFRLRNVLNTFRNREEINSDHRWWFSPYSISKVCVQSGLRPNSIFFTGSYRVPRFALFRKLILTLFPGLRDTIIILASF